MRVTVLGMGYVGCVTAAVLAREGHSVVGVDSNPTKLAMLDRGEPPVLEPGLGELLRRGRLAGRITVSDSAERSVERADVAIICVGTPSAPNGALDTSFLTRVIEQIGKGIRDHRGYPVVVVRSTVLPTIVEGLLVPTLEAASGRKVGQTCGLVVNPEFLREGSSLDDFDRPQFTLIGSDDDRAAEVVRRMYFFLKRAPFVVTDRRTASLIKYASNAYHALKVAFANEIGAISLASGVNPQEVMRIFCMDQKLNVSASYLKPGMPFGGSCLPKDVRALVHHGRERDTPLALLPAVLESNRLRTEECVQRILANGRPRVGIFGLAFKAGTDDLRESPTVEIIERLIGKGAEVAIYDGKVSLANLMGANREYIAEHLPHVAKLLRPTLDEVVKCSDVLVVTNRDEEFRRVAELMGPDQQLVDLAYLMTEARLPVADLPAASES